MWLSKCVCVVFACISSHLVLLCLLYVHAYIEHTSQLWSLARRRLSTAAATAAVDVVRPKCQVVCTHTNILTHWQQHTHRWQLEQFPFLCAAHKPSTLARESDRMKAAPQGHVQVSSTSTSTSGHFYVNLCFWLVQPLTYACISALTFICADFNKFNAIVAEGMAQRCRAFQKTGNVKVFCIFWLFLIISYNIYYFKFYFQQFSTYLKITMNSNKEVKFTPAISVL